MSLLASDIAATAAAATVSAFAVASALAAVAVERAMRAVLARHLSPVAAAGVETNNTLIC